MIDCFLRISNLLLSLLFTPTIALVKKLEVTQLAMEGAILRVYGYMARIIAGEERFLRADHETDDAV